MVVVTMQASSFKARCLAVLDEVERTHSSVVITKHGRAVARLVPIDDMRPTMGSVTLMGAQDDEYFSTGESWDAAD
jgi:prevent-host-death family protein